MLRGDVLEEFSCKRRSGVDFGDQNLKPNSLPSMAFVTMSSSAKAIFALSEYLR